MTLKILCLHGMSQNAEVFRTRLGRLPNKAKAVATFHYESAPHLMPLREGDSMPMCTWYVRDRVSGSIESSSLQASLNYLDDVWLKHGPFDGVLGFSMGGSMAVVVASLPQRFPGLRCLLVGGARDLPAEVLQSLTHSLTPTGTGTGDGALTLTLPSLHLIGAADKVVPPESSRVLAARFTNPVIVEHEQGHCIPSRAAMLDGYVKFLKEVHDTPLTVFKEPNAAQVTSAVSETVHSTSVSVSESESESVVCYSDDVALLQCEEMEVISSIFPSEITLLHDLPTAAGDLTVAFDVQLSYAGDTTALPCVRWAECLSLRIVLPTQYPVEGLPHVEVRTGNMGLHEFKSAHRMSLLKTVRAQAVQSAGSSGGEMVLLDCIQAGNDWLSGGVWECGSQLEASDKTPILQNDEVSEEGCEVDAQQEQQWVEAATEEACKAFSRFKGTGEFMSGSSVVKEKEEEVSERHSTGVWGYTVGLVGKPSAGKSTFYNAVTRAILDSRGGRKVAEVAAHPFTTIEPNVGPGWYLSSQEDLPPSHSQESVIVDRSSAYGRVHGRRLLPVVVKDVAGLVPGAYQGRGKGNKFLGDLCDADVLVHVVDCTGQADRDGNKVVLDPYSSNSSNLNGSTPAEDAAWIREELHRWIYGNVRAKWESVIRRGEGARCWQRVVSLFSGYQGYDPKRIVEKAAQIANLNLDKAGSFSDFDIHRMVAHYLSVRFPTCLALNKIDELPPDVGEEVVRQCQDMALARGEVAVPVSARAECRVLQKLLEAQVGGLPKKDAEKEEAVLQQTISRWGSTGVLEAISSAVQLSPPVLCYPVADLETEAPLGWTSRHSHPGQKSDGQEQSVEGQHKSENCSGLKIPCLQDCLQLKPYSTVHDVFESLKKNAIANVSFHGDFVRADGKSLALTANTAAGGRKQLRRDQVISQENCVVKIYSNKKHTWQKDYA